MLSFWLFICWFASFGYTEGTAPTSCDKKIPCYRASIGPFIRLATGWEPPILVCKEAASKPPLPPSLPITF
jgi:hypothetical protein